jgi:hypothetical protein
MPPDDRPRKKRTDGRQRSERHSLPAVTPHRLLINVRIFALSYQSSSPHMMDLHPGESPRRFGVQTDPIYHVYLANAVTLAYSAIEELGLEVRDNPQNPSKTPDGTWNNPLFQDLVRRPGREPGLPHRLRSPLAPPRSAREVPAHSPGSPERAMHRRAT